MDRRNALTAVACLITLSLCGFIAVAQPEGGQQNASNTGVVTVLTAAAPAGSNVLKVLTPSQIDRDERLLLKSKDGLKFEVHYITRITGLEVYLDAPLVKSYSPNDLLIQGCECDKALGNRPDGLVGNLNEEVPARTTVLKFTPVVAVDPKAKLLIRKTDGTEEEVHSIKTYNGTDTITLDGKLKHSFEPGDMLIQGCHLPVTGGFPWWGKTLLIGGGTSGAITTVVTVVDDCNECP